MKRRSSIRAVIVICLASLVAAGQLFGCTASSTSGSATQGSSAIGVSSQGTTAGGQSNAVSDVEPVTEQKGVPLAQAINGNGAYILNEDKTSCRLINQVSDAGTTEVGDISVMLNSGAEVETLDRSKSEQLILIGETGEKNASWYKIHPVVEHGYWQGDFSDYYVISDFDELNGVPITSHDQGVELLAQNGLGYKRYKNTKGVGCYMWTSGIPTSVEVGEYEGTKYNERTVTIDTPYYCVSIRADMEYPIDVEKTRDGYFIAHIENVDAGYYQIGSDRIMQIV